ncbi:hypothetical protein AwMethylo_22730 [Methylobacterium sp.]|nr:hypothetical protein AwMethylo_22730 [Methylobacterium sp.]
MRSCRDSEVNDATTDSLPAGVDATEEKSRGETPRQSGQRGKPTRCRAEKEERASGLSRLARRKLARLIRLHGGKAQWGQ